MKITLCSFLFAFVSHGLSAQQIRSFKTSDNESLHYTSIGKGPRVVLLWGGPGFNVSMMKPWADSLSRNFECILFDQRGTGLSSNAKLDSTTINIKRAADDIEDLRKHLGESQLTVCGTSWGGALCQIYAGFYPGNVKKMVLVSTLGPDLSLIDAFIDNINMRRHADDADSLKYWAAQPDSKTAEVKRTLFGFLPYFYDQKLGRTILSQILFSGAKNKKMGDLMWQDLYKNYDIKVQLKAYKGECTIIQPRQDVIPGAETAFQVQSILPQTKIHIIERCGHFPDLEKPGELYRLLRKAL
jgi:proline iminopeptidase